MITNKDKTYIFLSSLDLSYKKFSDIVSHYSCVDEVLHAIDSAESFIVQEFDQKFDTIQKMLNDFSFQTFEDYLKTNNVGYVTIEDDKYPQKLLELDQPPFILYYKGNLELVNTPCIAMVGTRKPSFYGQDVTEKFAKGLTENGFTIVSGLAVGVDKISHETCLKYGGNTIAVLGNGFEHMYPAMNINLSKDIAQKGLLLTEYYPSFKATSYSFPARNRIIAGLSKGVLVTEAGEKSGALYTKDFALELGRDVFSIPGNVNNINSKGTNNIIKSGHGACVTCVEDILDSYGMTAKNKKEKKIQLNFDEQRIYDYLTVGERNFDDLQIYTNLSVQNLNTCLTTMQIRGIIKKLPGNYYSV